MAARTTRRGHRTLALFDVENLLAGDPADAVAADYQNAITDTAVLAGLRSTDSAVLAVGAGNRTGLFACARTWPGAAVRCRSGIDGADRALTDHVADLHAVARCFDRVVIGSGDHHFVDCARTLRVLGVGITVVSRHGKLSHLLRRTADRVLVLPGDRLAPIASPIAAAA